MPIILLLAPHICDAQTKRRHVSPWCGDDVDALGLGAAMIWVMLGAILAPHHGWPIFSASGASTEPFFDYVDLYVGLVQFWIKKGISVPIPPHSFSVSPCSYEIRGDYGA